MAIQINPTIAQLGIAAPVLGPWFSIAAAVTLPARASLSSLGIPITPTAVSNWLPPTAGTLSLFINNPLALNQPIAIDTLQDADGKWPFQSTGGLLAYFQLLPEIETRLAQFSSLIPAATAAAAAAAAPLPSTIGLSTRATVRSLVLEIAPPGGGSFTAGQIIAHIEATPPPDLIPGDTQAKKLNALGLVNRGGSVSTSAKPMTWLRRPGGAVDTLIQNVPIDGRATLWAFDQRGRAIDPGAVACWWSWLLNQGVGAAPPAAAPLQLASSPPPAYPVMNGSQVVCLFNQQLTAHLVDPHEGSMTSNTAFMNRPAKATDRLLQWDDTGVASQLEQSLVQVSGARGLQFGIAPLPAVPVNVPAPTIENPQPDNAPVARIAVLPNGPYQAMGTTPATALNLWPSGPVLASLTRDFIRVAVVDEEFHLTGLNRSVSDAGRNPADATTDPKNWTDGQFQNCPSTRINVSRTADNNRVLLTDSQATANALLALPNNRTQTRLILGIADRRWGGTPIVGAPLAAALPTALPMTLTDSGNSIPGPGQFHVQSLIGGGQSEQVNQSVLVTVNLGVAPAPNAMRWWIRAYPVGFDVDSGTRPAMLGGAGRADITGTVRLVMRLPDALATQQAILGVQFHAVYQDVAGFVIAQQRYSELRFNRPMPLPGAAAVNVAGNWVICETGQLGNGALPAGAIPPGAHVVLLGVSPTAVNTLLLPAASFDGNTLAQITNNNPAMIVSLTQPAFRSSLDAANAVGQPLSSTDVATLDSSGGLQMSLGANVHLLSRTGTAVGLTQASKPYHLMERLEVAGTAFDNGTGQPMAVIGSVPPVPWLMQPASLPALAAPVLAGLIQFPGPMSFGFAGAAAGFETHGVGVVLTGPPALAVSQFTMERTAGLGQNLLAIPANEPGRSTLIQSAVALVADAASNVAGAMIPALTPGPVVAVLRTVAPGVEGILGENAETMMPPINLFPAIRPSADLNAWLGTQGPIGRALAPLVGPPLAAAAQALDRRIYASVRGAFQMRTSLLAAIARAQDLIYLETPSIDNTAFGDGTPTILQALIDRMNARLGLRLILCCPVRLSPHTPKQLRDVRNKSLLEAITAMRAAHPLRFAFFNPGTGAGRSLRIASTVAVVDDVIAFAGTTHLTRRGMTWDSSLSASVFDENVQNSRCAQIIAFRTQLLADRLGIVANQVPTDAKLLINAINDLDASGSSVLAHESIDPDPPSAIPKPNNDGGEAAWNPDGTQISSTLTSITGLLVSLLAQTDTINSVQDD
jgi:hypothetical protein